MNIFKKLIFFIKRPSVILVTGEGRACAAQAISQVLKSCFKMEKVLLFESDLSEAKELNKFNFLLRKSRLPVLVVTHIGEIPADKYFFAGEREKTIRIKDLAKALPSQGVLILNFDDETARELKNETMVRSLTYGFQERADFQASDININTNGTNFKMNYEGNIVPFWLKNLFGKEQIYSALAAVIVGTIKDVNLVKISQALSSYKSLPGRMGLVGGIKNSLILDDSAFSSPFSMVEGLGILGKLEIEGRKIAVLGDILRIGKYTIEAHETIGEKAARASDLLFTVGSRAKFFAKGAVSKGMAEQNIFQFDKIEEAKEALQKEIKEGDLILVDGSREMHMGEIVEEIRA